ncbi:hypothetical protein MASR2M70_13540 [Bacillota bacterium]
MKPNKLKSETSKGILITIAGDFDAGLSVIARQLLPKLSDGSTGNTARADAEGISGGILAATNGIYATADVNGRVESYLGNGTDINVAGIMEIAAVNSTRQLAYTKSVNIAGGLTFLQIKQKPRHHH